MRSFIVLILLWTSSMAVAVERCATVLGASPTEIEFVLGSLVRNPDYPAPRFSNYYLGEGGTATVHRIIDHENGTSFVEKSYIRAQTLKNDLKVFEFLRSVHPERFGIRLVKILAKPDAQTLRLEDIQGVTLRDAVLNKVLPEKELDQLLHNLYLYQKEIFFAVKLEWLSSAQLYFVGPKTLGFPDGIPTLKAHYGLLSKFLFLKSDNILLDIKTRQLVIIDPN